jgi:hypothetical protein
LKRLLLFPLPLLHRHHLLRHLHLRCRLVWRPPSLSPLSKQLDLKLSRSTTTRQLRKESSVSPIPSPVHSQTDDNAAFREGEAIVSIEFVSEEWWQGTSLDGTIGVFPANYVELQE